MEFYGQMEGVVSLKMSQVGATGINSARVGILLKKYL
jgi:hypothetical protein